MKKTQLIMSILALCISVNFYSQSYCVPTFTNPCSGTQAYNGYIESVYFGDILTSSTCNGNINNYINYAPTVQTTTVNAGGKYYLEVYAQTYGSSSCGIMAWIDFNQDGDFGGVNEYIFENTANNFFADSILIPATANNGQTRMRIIRTGGIVGSSIYCGNFSLGETEDYTITITGGTGTPGSLCTITPQGTDASNWSYYDFIIPSGFKVDSVFMDATRSGFPVSDYDFVVAYCQGVTAFNSSLATYPFSYSSISTSLYNTWIDLSNDSINSTGMIRVSLPTNAGAIWNGLCIVTSPMPSQCNLNLSSGLVAQYEFSGNANDISGNSHNGNVNGATLTDDRFGNPNSAYDFSSSVDKIVVANSTDLSLTGDFGFNFWIKPRSYNGTLNGIISKMESGSCNHYGYFMSMYSWGGENKIDFQADPICSNASAYLPNNDGVLQLNQWYNIGITYNDTESKLKYYKDGILFDSIIQSLDIQNTAYDLIIGNHLFYPYTLTSTGQNFDGIIDDIRIYNRELTPCEMDSLYLPAQPIGTQNLNSSNNLNLIAFPNPVNNDLYFKTNTGEEKTIEIINSTGQLVLKERIAGNTIKINTIGLPNGIYFYKVINVNHIMQNGKFIVEKS